MKICVEWRDAGPLLGLVLTSFLAQVSYLPRNRLFIYKSPSQCLEFLKDCDQIRAGHRINCSVDVLD